MQERILLIQQVIILHLERVDSMSVENGTTGCLFTLNTIGDVEI